MFVLREVEIARHYTKQQSNQLVIFCKSLFTIFDILTAANGR
jgi:hypothetical protein